MTHIKSKLMMTAVVLAFAGTPAFAQSYGSGNKAPAKTETQDSMKKDEMKKSDTMMKDGDAMMKDADHMMKDGHHMMEDGKMMKSDAMKKNGAMMSHSMTAEQRMAAEKRILSSMTEKQRETFMKMEPAARKAMMNKKLTGDYMVDKGAMMDAPIKSGAIKVMDAEETIGAVMQSGETSGQTMMKDDMMMSDGELKMKSTVKMQDSDHMAKDNMIAVPTVGSNVVTTVSCPVGTTAQTNGTCMITGNYQY